MIIRIPSKLLFIILFCKFHLILSKVQHKNIPKYIDKRDGFHRKAKQCPSSHILIDVTIKVMMNLFET